VEFLVFLLLSLVVWVAGVQIWTRRKQRARKHALLIERGGFRGLFEALGLEPLTSSNEVNAASGLGGDLTVRFFCGSIEAITDKTRLAFELDLGDAVPSRVSMHSRNPFDERVENRPVYHLRYLLEHGGTSNLFDFIGATRDTLPLMGSPLTEHAAEVHIAAPNNGTRVSLKDSILTIQITRTDFVTRDDDHATLRALVTTLESLHRAMSERDTEPAELIRLMRGKAARAEYRWAAARVLCTHHAGSAEVSALVGGLSDENDFTRAACVRWSAPDGPFTTTSKEAVAALSFVCEHRIFSEEVNALLLREYAFDTMMNPGIPSFVRTDASEDAWSEHVDPKTRAERDAQLAELFTSRIILGTLPLEIVFDNLTTSGWRPSPENALAIATDGLSSSPALLSRSLEGSPDLQRYAGALSVLERNGVKGAAELFASLDLDEVGGQLSLVAEDSVKGGLSAAGERGGLTTVDD
jgi:hypothetical protein